MLELLAIFEYLKLLHFYKFAYICDSFHFFNPFTAIGIYKRLEKIVYRYTYMSMDTWQIPFSLVRI